MLIHQLAPIISTRDALFQKAFPPGTLLSQHKDLHTRAACLLRIRSAGHVGPLDRIRAAHRAVGRVRRWPRGALRGTAARRPQPVEPAAVAGLLRCQGGQCVPQPPMCPVVQTMDGTQQREHWNGSGP